MLAARRSLDAQNAWGDPKTASGAQENLCARFANATLEAIKRHEIKHVFLVARWILYTTGTLDGSEAPAHAWLVHPGNWGYAEDSMTVFAKALQETLDQLNDVDVTIVLDVPEQRYTVWRYMFARALWRLPADDGFWTTREELVDRYRPVMDIFRKAVAGRPNVTIVDPMDILCQDQRCMVRIGDVPIYADEDHLSVKGAGLLEPLFAPIFQSMGHVSSANSPEPLTR